MGYEAQILTDSLTCEAKEAGSMLGSIARYNSLSTSSRAFIFGGETVVRLNGAGMGGRSQELALAAAEKLSGIDGACVFAVGSDGTDGPTDAAGGYVDGHTKEKLEQKGISIQESLKNNDSYNALKAIDGLIITGPTGTNVNDLYAVLINR
jgi:glycerate 2-kinase